MRKFFVLFLMIPIIHCSCPDGFELVIAGECRMSKPIKMQLRHNQGIDTAISQCNAFGAHPIIIHNDEQQNYWSYRSTTSSVLLGLTCESNGNKYQWWDGSAVDYKPTRGTDGLGKCKMHDCTWQLYSNGYWEDHCASDVENYVIYCIKQLKPPVPSADGCESFEDDSGDGVCYQVGATASNWKEAQIICASFGAQVASIHNEKENSFVRRIATSKGAVSGMYLGASLSGKGNEFSWMDGSKWDYDNFYPGFPMNGLGECIIMDTSGTSGNWVNVDCSSHLSVACERKQHYTTPTCSSGPFVEGQILYSAGFPFHASTPCDFILSVDAGKKLELEVLLLEANSCCDHLIIYENYFGGTVIANLTGQVNDMKYTTSSSNFMRVSWQPNGGVNVRGAMFTYKAV